MMTPIVNTGTNKSLAPHYSIPQNALGDAYFWISKSTDVKDETSHDSAGLDTISN